MTTGLTSCSFSGSSTSEIYSLSLHDALPISADAARPGCVRGARPHLSGALRRMVAALRAPRHRVPGLGGAPPADRKSTRLNSSHANISYAVFCLKRKIGELHGAPGGEQPVPD